MLGSEYPKIYKWAFLNLELFDYLLHSSFSSRLSCPSCHQLLSELPLFS